MFLKKIDIFLKFHKKKILKKSKKCYISKTIKNFEILIAAYRTRCFVELFAAYWKVLQKRTDNFFLHFFFFREMIFFLCRHFNLTVNYISEKFVYGILLERQYLFSMLYTSYLIVQILYILLYISFLLYKLYVFCYT